MSIWIVLAFIVMVAVPLVVRAESAVAEADNPLLEEWRTPFEAPPFDRIRAEHFLPAFQEAIARHEREVAAIGAAPEPPTFANTIEALEVSGALLERVAATFSCLRAAETNDALQVVARQVLPLLAAHNNDILLDAALFRRVRAVWEQRESLGVAGEEARLLELTWKSFVRGGARLDAAAQARLRAIDTELAGLSVRFGDNLLQETNAFRLVVEDARDLAGLPEGVVAAAAEAAQAAGLAGRWLFTLRAPSLTPFLQNAATRELRRQIFAAYTSRADHGDARDNKALAARTAALRAERAALLGYATYADFVLEESMAKTPARVRELLDRVWPKAQARAEQEARALQAAIEAEGHDFVLAPHDWAYYAEKVRRERYAFDEQALRPYFELGRVRAGAFDVARRLYGVTFEARHDVPVYHPEVETYEVRDADGTHLGLLYLDPHPRPGKSVGAWSARLRSAHVQRGRSIRPLVVNVTNFARPAGGAPALLSVEEVRTLFHEFGHALHALLSRVRYKGLAQTPRDFVELPSQLMENWAFEPEVLRTYARHYETGAPIPSELVDKLEQARRFNQGFATLEYLAASQLDLDWHTQGLPAATDAAAFERAALQRLQLPHAILPRYRSPYFQHIFVVGYAAGYYSYIWSEVLDADAFQAFKERGLFDQATARALRTHVLERGNSEDVLALYVRFRGREPSVEPLLARRGL